jgi:signal transduction histidine kinase
MLNGLSILIDAKWMLKAPMHDIKYPLLLKFLIPYTLATVVILSIGGWFFYHTSLRSVDHEFSKRLTSISEMVSVSINTAYLVRLRPGDEETRLYQILLHDLRTMRDRAGVKDIYIFDRDRRILIEASGEIPVGQEYLLLKLDQTELDEVWEGTPTASTLYQGSDDFYYKSGYAPVRDYQGKIIAVAGVEAGVEFLESVQKIKQQVLWIVVISLLVQFSISLIISQSIANPLKVLVTAIDRVGKEETYTKVKINTQDEIGFLGSRFNEMTDSLREKDLLLKDRMDALKQLSAGIAHEIRNPLAAIGGFAELLGRKVSSVENPQVKKLAEEIIQEVKNLNRIVTDFLSFAREPRRQFEQVDIVALLEGALTLALSGEKGGPITVEKEMPSHPPPLMGDPLELRKALLNVILNSIQALPGGGRLKILLHTEGSWLTITIQDSGVGIPPQVRDRIFDPFFTTKEKGTGLGLAITQRIIEGHGGHISFESRPGEGTQFMIRLPISDHDEADTESSRPSSSAGGKVQEHR